MKKTIYILILMSSCIFSLKALSVDSLVEIKGYYITQLNKKEIEDSYNQKINKIKGDSFFVNIDYTSFSFFIPLQIGEEVLYKEGITYDDIIRQTDLNKDTIYYMPTSKRFEKYISRLLNKEIDLSKEICILQEAKQSYPYYLNDNKDNYLYKCVYVESKALKINMPNTEKNRLIIDLDLDAVNRNLSKVTVFFLVNITSYTPFVDFLGLNKWYPYTNYSEAKRLMK